MLPQIMCPGMGLDVSEERILFLISTKIPFELVAALALSGHSDSQRYCRQAKVRVGGGSGSEVPGRMSLTLSTGLSFSHLPVSY